MAETLTPIKFHARLKSLAKVRDILIKDVETQAGLPIGTIINWKKSFPAADTLGKVAVALNTSVDYLLGLTDCHLPPETGTSSTTSIILNSLWNKDLKVESAIAIVTTIEAISILQNSLLGDFDHI